MLIIVERTRSVRTNLFILCKSVVQTWLMNAGMSLATDNSVSLVAGHLSTFLIFYFNTIISFTNWLLGLFALFFGNISTRI